MSGRLDLHLFSNLYPDLLQDYSPNNFSQETRLAKITRLDILRVVITKLFNNH